MRTSFVVFYFIGINCFHWQKDERLLPRIVQNMAVGTWNNTIYLLGGFQDGYQLVAFNPSDQTDKAFYDYGGNELLRKYCPTLSCDPEIYGLGQFYTQINHTLYMVRKSGGHISTYNMNTNLFVLNAFALAVNVWYYSCLASTNKYLFAIGGSSVSWGDGVSTNITQRLSRATLQWDISHMIEPRKSLSCIVYPNTNSLYAIGGQNDLSLLSTVEIYETD
eukprot:150196_1